jgi:DNA-binding HxlR family transcriptional regulator
MSIMQPTDISSLCTSSANLEEALRVVASRWKPLILFHLFGSGVLRFSDIQRKLLGVSHKVLAAQLRELERDGVITRTVYPEVPPRVDYALTALGAALLPSLKALDHWGAQSRSARTGDGVVTSPNMADGRRDTARD